MSETPTPINPVEALFMALTEHLDAETIERLRLDFEYNTLEYTKVLLDLPEGGPIPPAERLLQMIMNLLTNRRLDYDAGLRAGLQAGPAVKPKSA